jgi:hypothetical protein
MSFDVRVLVDVCGPDAFSLAGIGTGFVRVGFTWLANRLGDSSFILSSVLSSRRNVWLPLAVGPDTGGTGLSVTVYWLVVCMFSLSFWAVGGGAGRGWVALSSLGGCFLVSEDFFGGAFSPLCVFLLGIADLIVWF